jgi:DNA-binding XRE family transcriptional regulator
MNPTAFLVTDRPGFEGSWHRQLQQAGFDVDVVGIDALAESAAAGSAVVLDAGSEVFDEDELLASVGLARALKACVAVALPESGELVGVEEILDDLCLGLVARNAGDVVRVAGALARRCDRDRGSRFEYLTVSPRPDELLAVLGDGEAVLLPRPVADDDDGSEVTAISISEDAASAAISLSTGKEVTLLASSAARALSSGSGPLALPADVGADAPGGPRLGARLRHLRLQAGLTQAELARRTGIHRPNIARVEAGRHTPSLETLTRMASAIGVSAAAVLAEE